MSGGQEGAEGSGDLILSELPKGMKRCVFIVKIMDESLGYMIFVSTGYFCPFHAKALS
jgi:hypothetical protein